MIAKLKSLNILYLASFLFLITFLFYSNTLFNGLFFDDEQFIYNNQTVRTFDLHGFFSHSLTSGAGKLSNYYRPLLFMGFGLEYQVSGANGFLYHFDSVLIHIAGGIVLFLFLDKLFRNRFVAFLTALLFLIHPLQTEAVAYVSGRGDPLSFFFCLLALYLSLYQGARWKVASLLCLILALLSKEIALMLPALLLLTQVFSAGKITKHTLWKSFLISVPFWIVAALYFLLRITILDFANTLNFYNATNAYSASLFVRLNTFFDLLPQYLGLLFFPKTLFMERDSLVKIATTPTLSSSLSFLFCLLFFASCLYLYVKKKQPIFLFGLLWFGISFLPTCGIIPINGIFYEHFLYYPSVGFFLIFSYLLYLLYRQLPTIGKNLLLVAICCVLLALGLRTFARNLEWHDPVTFYKQTLSHVQSPRAYNNLAMAYADQNDNKEAIQMYQAAISLSDTYPETRYNLGNSYLAIGQTNRAIREYKKALDLDPTFYRSYISLYQLYASTKNEQGIQEVKKRLTQLGKKYPQFFDLLSQLEQKVSP